MWNFLEFLYVVCGAVTAYFLIKDTLNQKGSINAQEAAMIALAFFGGAFSLMWLVSQEGDKIVLFRKPSEQQTSAPTAAYTNQDPPKPQPQTAPAPQPEQKSRSVLDG
jgi:hypothetical protein